MDSFSWKKSFGMLFFFLIKYQVFQFDMTLKQQSLLANVNIVDSYPFLGGCGPILVVKCCVTPLGKFITGECIICRSWKENQFQSVTTLSYRRRLQKRVRRCHLLQQQTVDSSWMYILRQNLHF